MLTIKSSLFKALGFILLSVVAHTKLFAAELNQESTQLFGDYKVHYTAFNSTFIQPNIAENYGLVRAGDVALINIAVQDKDGKAVAATLKGYAQNLMQQQKALEFKTFNEQNAIYSLASLRITNEEVFNLVIEITPPDAAPFTLKFTRKFYVE